MTTKISSKLSAPSTVRGVLRDQRGASFVEYVIVVGLLAIVCIGAFKLFGQAVDNKVKAQTTKINSF